MADVRKIVKTKSRRPFLARFIGTETCLAGVVIKPNETYRITYVPDMNTRCGHEWLWFEIATEGKRLFSSRNKSAMCPYSNIDAFMENWEII